MKTSKTRKSQGESMNVEKSSGKKMVQARLPFKILSTPPTCSGGEAATKDVDKKTKEVRKRRLSYEKEEADNDKTLQASKKRSLKNVANVSSKKKQKEGEKNSSALEIVELSDSNGEDTSKIIDSGHKENLKITSKQKHVEIVSDKDVCNDDAELVESSDNETHEQQDKTKSTPEFSKMTKPTTSTGKKPTNTPQSGKKRLSKGRKSKGDSSVESSRVQIKLPLSTKKNKRRKVPLQAAEITAEHELSDDVEISDELHLQKRPKLDETEVTLSKKEANNENKKADGVEDQHQEEKEDAKQTETTPKTVSKKRASVTKISTETLNSNKKQTEIKKSPDKPKTKEKKHESDEEENSESDLNKTKSQNGSNTTTDVEDNIDTETTIEPKKLEHPKKVAHSNKNIEDKSVSYKATNEHGNLKTQKSSLTPKQQKLIEQRLKAREEKERKIQEERLQKQREKEDRELAKKREREEKEEKRRKEREEREEQKRKEREEKEEQRRKEKEEKEIKRLAENEAKNEEKRNKEEERKRKEQEKEEAELKKKKAALAFTKFFSRPVQDATGQSAKENDVSLESNEALAFRPFQIKGDMKLAPVVRKKLNTNERTQLDEIVEKKEKLELSKLYLAQLKTGAVRPCKWLSPVVSENSETKPIEEDDDDVVIVEDELERAGQAIVEEHNEPVERLRSKFYKFHENQRPPYYGTWRKKSSLVTPRRPFAQDKKFFDYEVDSDEEWEEEEPGESLDGSDDDKEKESEDEDYEVDNEWFVPHGHLSDEELQNKDDLGENNDREAQKAKLQILQQEFAQEMKKKTEKIKPRLIGCIWVDENGNQPELCPKIIWNTLSVRTILCAEPPIMEEPETIGDKNNDGNIGNSHNGERSSGDNKLKPIVLTEEMLKKLVRLVHGNTHSKNFLINEFIAYVEANEESIKNGDKKVPLKSAVRDKIQEYAKWEIILKTNHEDNIISSNNKKNKKKLCWVVSDETLEKMNMKDLDLKNDWQYVLKPRIHVKTTPAKVDTPNLIVANSDDSNEQSETSVEQSGTPLMPQTKSNKQTSDIKKFAKILTPAEKAQQLQRQVEQMKTPSTKTDRASLSSTKTTPKTNTAKSDKHNNTNQIVKKRVPLLMSVARGQAISTPDKNARINEFLKSMKDKKTSDQQNNNSTNTTKPITIIDTMEID